MKCKLFHLFIFLIISFLSNSQVINGYARVSNISGTTLTLANVNEVSDSFEDGELVIIMQMQDNVIGANTSDNSSFGNLSSINSAGLYEVRSIASHVESGGTPTSITLSSALSNTYVTGSNSRVQIISYPTLGSPDYTTTGNFNSRRWNGNRGGILAFRVVGTLTIAHNLNADNDGFRGASANNDASSAGCTGGSNFRVTTQDDYADKGEGIYRVTNSTYDAGKAKVLNGGGGGNSHNGGGGGGGNYTAGGDGGPGYPTCSPSAGGQGGIALSGHISADRIFMGGGGGSGEGNNTGTPDAGDGGGIVIITANEIVTTGNCGGRSVTANGESVTTGSGGDGNSGAGAGGTVIFNVNSWSIAATCPITVEANGGDGGDVNHGDIHGAGGGGGMGAVIFSITEPTTNTTVNTLSGNGGSNCNTCGDAGDGGGSPDDGIIDNSSGPLPVSLIYFDIINELNYVEIEWSTLSEMNNNFFRVEKSSDGVNWVKVGELNGAGNSNTKRDYRLIDEIPFLNTSFYRLSQIDFDGTVTTYKPKSVNRNRKGTNETLKIYPNPMSETLTIIGQQDGASMQLYNSTLSRLATKFTFLEKTSNRTVLDVSNLPNGIYFLKINSSFKKIIKQ